MVKKAKKKRPRVDKEMSITFGNRLRYLREQQSMTQPELALRAGMGKTGWVMVSRYEGGTGKLPNLRTFAALAGALETSADYLIGLSEKP